MDHVSPSPDTIFAQAIEIESPEERSAFLKQSCQGDAQLLGEVKKLVQDHFRAGAFLERPALDRQQTSAFQSVSETAGTQIGPYKLLQQIGEGGMGVVYMAEQQKPVRRRVALKIIKPGMDSRQVIARFEAERQALAMMDHPNIARVLDASCTESGRPYFVMELIQGIPITQYCDDKQLNTSERLELFIQVCQAVQHAHQKGIIHRDLKPSNVLVMIYDGKPIPKIIDFGVAKALHQQLTEKTLFTQFGAVVGTLEYMSPEQAEMDVLGTDTRTDVYSLGVLLYELLTGSTPLDGKKLRSLGYAEMLKTIREVDPPKPSTRLSQSAHDVANISAKRHTEPRRLQKLITGDLDWIVMKCLEKDRTRRYETANGLSMDIQRHLQDEAVTACPPGQLYKLQKLVRRNKLACTAAACVMLALMIGLVASLWQAERAAHEAERARSAEHQALATLDELRATAPTFVAEAKTLAAKGQFDLAIEKLDYAAKLQPDAPELLVTKGDFYLCQLKFPEAAAAYRDALRLKPGLAPAEMKANLCDQLLAAPTSAQGKLDLESLVKIYSALEPEKRSAAELKAVKEAYADENERQWNYWLPRLQSLPVFAHLAPGEDNWAGRFEVRNDGKLGLFLGDLDPGDLTQLKDVPVADLYLANCKNVTDVQPLADILSLENITVPPLARNIEALHKLPKLKRLSFSYKAKLSPDEQVREQGRLIASLYSEAQKEAQDSNKPSVQNAFMRRAMLFNIDGRLDSRTPDATAEEFWKEYPTLSWLSRLRDSAIKPNEISRRPDGTWNLNFQNKKEFTDLTLLHGMPISVLSLGLTPVTDLSPLRGMPLKELSIFYSKVTDLTPIEGMPITSLDVSGIHAINDITPLKGMPLYYLALDGTAVSDLMPLRGMPLTTLRLKDCANATDLSPLADVKELTQLVLPPNYTDFEFLHTLPKLQRLSFDVDKDNGYQPDKTADQFWVSYPSWTGKLKAAGIDFSFKLLKDGYYDVTVHDPKFTDCSNFKGSNVRRLDLDKSQVTDLSPLADLPLAALSLRETPVKDLSPLRSPTLRDSLRELRVWKTKVTDFSPIAGCAKLELFDAYGLPLTDLSIFKGMMLHTLLIGETKVTDLSPVAGMPLVTVNLDRTSIKDVSPLLKCPTLKALVLPTNPENIESLHGLPNLARLSYSGIPGGDPDKSADEFWKEYDRAKGASVP